MMAAVWIILAMVVVGFILWLTDRLSSNGTTEADEVPAHKVNSCTDDSCILHSMCEKEPQEGMGEAIVYYEDYELDEFRGIAPDRYTQEQAELFAEVLRTLRHHEIAPWTHSLHLRGIRLPASIRAEVLTRLKSLN